MLILNTVLPFVSFAFSLAASALVLRRFVSRRGLHLLFWGIGLVMYSVGGFCEGHFGAFGWSPVVFRLWYLFGAILVAAWLGQGTVYLLLPKRIAHALMVALVVASIYGAVRVIGAELDPARLTGSELSGHAITTPGVRTLTPFFNLYGTVALVGGAMWSAVVFWRRRILLHRTLGNLLIAVGAILPAFGGTFSRMGLPHALYIGELLGVVLIFLGYLRATTPMKDREVV